MTEKTSDKPDGFFPSLMHATDYTDKIVGCAFHRRFSSSTWVYILMHLKFMSVEKSVEGEHERAVIIAVL